LTSNAEGTGRAIADQYPRARCQRSGILARARDESIGDGDLEQIPRVLVTAFVIALVYLGMGVFDHDVWSPGEPAVFGVVREMYRTGALAVPRIDGMAYLEKPPLAYWLSWLSCRLWGGVGVGPIRLPSVLLGLASLMLVYRTARRRLGPHVALLVALLGATSCELLLTAHRAGADPVALFFTFLAFSVFLRTVPGAGETRRATTTRADLAFAFILATSFYAKNFYVALIVLPPVLTYLLWKGQIRRIVTITIGLALLMLLVVTPWVVALYRAGGWDYVRIVFVDNTLGRFFDLRGHSGFVTAPLNDAFRAEKEPSPFFYVPFLAEVSLPWAGLLAVSLVSLFRKWKEPDDYLLFLRLGVVVVPLFLSLSSSKDGKYLLPLLFIMLLAMGELVRDLLENRRPLARWEAATITANVAIVGVALVLATPIAAVIIGSPTPLIAALPIAVTALWFSAGGLRARDWRRWNTCGLAVVLAAGLLAASLIPFLDSQKSAAAFFAEIEPQVRGREIFSAFVDDRSLPLLTYHLDRRLPVARGDDEIVGLLRGGAGVGIILSEERYASLRTRLADVPLETYSSPRGKQGYLLVLAPDLRRAAATAEGR
jgi:4-amino-4-deoxy-L-arabinose transferase-like glycosyltransferase